MNTTESMTRAFSSAEAFRGAAELIGDTVEFDLICRLLNSKDEKLTQERVLDEALASGMDWADLWKMKQGFEKVGFPEEDEPMKVNLLTPREIEEILQTRNGNAVFNNEFVLFAYGQGRQLEGIEPREIMDMVAQFNPVRQRLRSLAPSLVKTLEEYATYHEGLGGFYAGLTEEKMDSWHHRTLFTIADQLLQRLVRPGDAQYKAECGRAWAGQKGPNKMFEAPVYDSLVLAPENIVTNARDYLYT